MNNHFFSIDDDDDGAPGGAAAVQPPGGRGRLGSAGSQSDGLNNSAGLFPIYEAPQQVFALPPAVDLDSTAGSEWESDFG